MADQKRKRKDPEAYRNAFRDTGTSEGHRREKGCKIEIEIDGDIFEVLVIPAPIAVVNEVNAAGEVSLDKQAKLFLECCRIPDTGEKLFDSPKDVENLQDAPGNLDGWYYRLLGAINWVHDWASQPPSGVVPPKAREIQAAAHDLRDSTRRSEEIGEEPTDQIVDKCKEIIDLVSGNGQEGDDKEET